MMNSVLRCASVTAVQRSEAGRLLQSRSLWAFARGGKIPAAIGSRVVNAPEKMAIRSFSAQDELTHGVRSLMFGLSSIDEIKEITDDPNVVFVDVRSPEEVEEAALTSQPYVHIHFDTAHEVQEKAKELLPNKDAPIVVYCGMGSRAQHVKDILKELGYTKVYNAGGLADLETNFF